MTKRVFIVQQPTRLHVDEATGERTRIPSVDLSASADWGAPVFLLSPTANPLGDLDYLAADVARTLDEHALTHEDYLLLVGNPALIAIVSAEVADRLDGHLRLLLWNGRLNNGYRLAEVKLWAEATADRPSVAASADAT